ncbi:MAG: hypothetical protein HY070_00350 [Chloroflexi bacterium]|nr:hypothetical protein [Chloroflexota bacterium]
MAMTNISIPLDAETAKIYAGASVEDQKKLRLLLSLWLREFAVSPRPLKVVIDEIGEKARERGLTSEILESIVNAN